MRNGVILKCPILNGLVIPVFSIFSKPFFMLSDTLNSCSRNESSTCV